MSELKKITFKEFVTLQRGFDLPKKNMKPGMYPVIGSTSIIGYHNEFKVDPPGVVTGRSGALGSVQYIPVKYWPHNTSLWIRDFKGNSPRYVYYFLQTLGLGQFNSGAAVPTLNRNDLDSLELKIHNLPTQRKISVVLSTYDDLIENNTRRIENLEEIASVIYREWFVEFRFPGHEGLEMVESKLGLIPRGWEVARLSDLVETQYGYTESATEDEVGPKFVRGTDINKKSYIDWSTVPFCPIESEKCVKYQLHTGDILVIRMADPGKVAIIEKEINAVFASYLIRLKLISNHLSPYYLFYTLLDRRYQNYIYGASTGTTRKSASAGVVTDFALIVPTDELTNRFEIVIGELRRTLNNLLDKNANLRQTRDLLLPKLISGEIDVSKLDIDTNGIQPRKGGAHIPYPLKDRLYSNENILGGKPVIKGTRLTVAFLLELLECGWSEAEVLENYPSIKREDLDACLAFQQEATRASVSG